MRKALKTASAEQLTDVFSVFDVTASYDKARQQLDLAATITPELLPENESDRSGERSRVLEVAGAGLIAKPATVIRAWATWDLARKRWLREGFW
jgi:hypothetical protein